MPWKAATPELRAKFSSDADAIKVLHANFTCSRGGVYRKKDAGYKPTVEELEALAYLFREWDYGYEA